LICNVSRITLRMPHTITTFAPGRVEILGNHTDYNLGFVLSAAIHLGVTIEASRICRPSLEISSQTNGRTISIELDNLRPLAQDPWASYPIGVIKVLAEAGFPVGGMQMIISSDLPLGAGLSSTSSHKWEAYRRRRFGRFSALLASHVRISVRSSLAP
jgi:galactokinase